MSQNVVILTWEQVRGVSAEKIAQTVRNIHKTGSVQIELAECVRLHLQVGVPERLLASIQKHLH